MSSPLVEDFTLGDGRELKRGRVKTERRMRANILEARLEGSGCSPKFWETGEHRREKVKKKEKRILRSTRKRRDNVHWHENITKSRVIVEEREKEDK